MSITEIASAKSTVTQILSTDDVSEVIDFAQDQVTTASITILTNNQFNFLEGLYEISCNLQSTRQDSTGFVRWYAFWELDTGSGYSIIPIQTTNESFSSNDSPEIHPVTKPVLYLDVTVANTKLRIQHQTDNSVRNVGIQSVASGASVPGDVASIIIDIAKVG